MRLTVLCAVAGLLLAACGGGGETAGQDEVSASAGFQGVEASGVIEASDSRDPNHANRLYDAYVFQADLGERVRIEVSTESFAALLKLVEVSTGAVLAEWDSQYPSGEVLEYVIAASGEYEARVYSNDDGTGEYRLVIEEGD